MKISEGYVVKKIAGEYLLIPYGQKIIENNQIIKLNDNSGMLLEYIRDTECTIEELISYVEAKRDKFTLEGNVKEQIIGFVDNLKQGGFLEEKYE